jgi:hypothetical protein
MPEYLLNQQARAVHEKADHRADEAGDGPEGPDQSLGEAGTEDAVELLARQAETIRAQVTLHSTEHFMQRLAARLASEAKRPTRVQYASAWATADADTLYPEEIPEVTQLAPPTAGPSPRTARPNGRPRSRRRRPTPINPYDLKASQYLAFCYVTELCSTILRSTEIDTLDAFAADYDEAGARTFGCLLYSLDKRESATYWWRFAAGAGDALAAHLLAAHHAATGPNADSRAWSAFSRMLGFKPDRHVPQPVRDRTELAPHFARDIPVRQEARVFLRYPRLPAGLMTR